MVILISSSEILNSLKLCRRQTKTATYIHNCLNHQEMSFWGTSSLALFSVGRMNHSQIWINTWNLRLQHSFRQRFQLPFRLPLMSPRPQIMVATCDIDDNVRAFGNKNFGEFTAIYIFNWGVERKNGGFGCTEWEKLFGKKFGRRARYLPARELSFPLATLVSSSQQFPRTWHA